MNPLLTTLSQISDPDLKTQATVLRPSFSEPSSVLFLPQKPESGALITYANIFTSSPAPRYSWQLGVCFQGKGPVIKGSRKGQTFAILGRKLCHRTSSD